jgi:hypothetical protein
MCWYDSTSPHLFSVCWDDFTLPHLSSPVDCQLTPWSPWSSCCIGSFLTNFLTKTRTRKVNISAEHGGLPCAEDRDKREICDEVCELAGERIL